jgi:hypothetical protein
VPSKTVFLQCRRNGRVVVKLSLFPFPVEVVEDRDQNRSGGDPYNDENACDSPFILEEGGSAPTAVIRDQSGVIDDLRYGYGLASGICRNPRGRKGGWSR